MEAVSLAGTIVQFTQVGLEFFSRFFALCRSANGTLEEISEQEKQVQALLQHIADLEALYPNQNRNEETKACRKILEQLLRMVDSTKGNGKPRITSNIKATARAMKIKHRIEQLNRELDFSIQGLQLRTGIRQTEGLESLRNQVENLTLLLKQPLESSHSLKPKGLGYPWETGTPDQHIRIDDGLDQCYFLPLGFCSSPKAFLKLLQHKFQDKRLPGLDLVRKSHLELWSWDGRTKLDSDTWDVHITSRRGLKVSFVMSTYLGFDHYKCIRCGEKQFESVMRRTYTTCSPCLLDFRWVEPGDIPYETLDTKAIPFITEALPAPISEKPSQQQKQSDLMQSDKSYGDKSSIERECRRLTMKWEPIVNITHRYLYCRCILRRSTSSPFPQEITFPVGGICPRHNNRGIVHADYGDQDYHQDPYFKQFGGYNAFRAMIFLLFPGVCSKVLGQQAFIADDERDSVVDELKTATYRLGSITKDAIDRYMFEVYHYAEVAGVVLPHDVRNFVRERKEKPPDKV